MWLPRTAALCTLFLCPAVFVFFWTDACCPWSTSARHKSPVGHHRIALRTFPPRSSSITWPCEHSHFWPSGHLSPGAEDCYSVAKPMQIPHGPGTTSQTSNSALWVLITITTVMVFL